MAILGTHFESRAAKTLKLITFEIRSELRSTPGLVV